MEIVFFSLGDVLRHTSEGDRQLVEVQGVVIAQGEFAEEVGNVLSLDESARHVLYGGLAERHGDDELLVHLTLHQVHVLARDLVAQQIAPILMAHHAVHLLGSVADGIEASDDGAHAGAHHIVDGDARLFDDLDGTDVCHTLGTSTAQHEAHFLACGQVLGLRGKGAESE